MFLWIDLETTGLNPHTNRILEVAVLRAERLTDPVSSVYHRVLKLTQADVWNIVKSDMLISDMHRGSGLLDDCLASSVEIKQVEQDLCTLLPEDGMPVTIAGFNPHFDLGFLREHVPRFAAGFSHRVFDITSIKRFCKELGMPPIDSQSEPPGEPPAAYHCQSDCAYCSQQRILESALRTDYKPLKHRAIPDIYTAWSHAMRCVQWAVAVTAHSQAVQPVLPSSIPAAPDVADKPKNEGGL
jgi:oligoribonuclease (3'-5' exoribonuclease)